MSALRPFLLHTRSSLRAASYRYFLSRHTIVPATFFLRARPLNQSHGDIRRSGGDSNSDKGADKKQDSKRVTIHQEYEGPDVVNGSFWAGDVGKREDDAEVSDVIILSSLE